MLWSFIFSSFRDCLDGRFSPALRSIMLKKPFSSVKRVPTSQTQASLSGQSQGWKCPILTSVCPRPVCRKGNKGRKRQPKTEGSGNPSLGITWASPAHALCCLPCDDTPKGSALIPASQSKTLREGGFSSNFLLFHHNKYEQSPDDV